MKYIIGIDEVGRGPLAGPVTVCAVLCEENLYKKLKKDNSPAVEAGNLPPLGKDSKKLSPKLRQKYSKYLKSLKMAKVPLATVMSEVPFDMAIVHVSNKIIDKKGISFAIKIAIEKAFGKMLDIRYKIQDSRIKSKNHYSKIMNHESKINILLDGGLKISKEFLKKYQNIKFTQSTIIEGDEKEKIIAWASILAKVSRDRLMERSHKKYPKYNFHIHKGYGTKLHGESIRKNGLSEIHRTSFCKNFV